jgi:FkbM family methyltransferase
MSLKDKIYIYIMYIYNLFFWNTLYKRNVYKRFLDRGDETNLINYQLNENSIVFDIWWYLWVFSDKIISKYNCYVYIYEPVKRYYEILKDKYKCNHKVKVFNFWLWDKFNTLPIKVDWERSSIFINKGIQETIIIRPFHEIIKEENIDKIDLISINIEWGEYDLIKNIIQNGIIFFIQNIQIQFHDFVEWAEKKREDLIVQIKTTHKILFSYPFVREAFTRKI